MNDTSTLLENNLLLPKVDFIFKKIFGEEKNKELLQEFLANVLNFPKEKITGLTLTNKELVKDYADDRKGTLGVRVEMDDENDKLEVCEMLATQNPVFDRAVEVQKSLSQNREIRAYYDRRLVEKTDELTHLYYATKKGLKQGMEQGLEQGMQQGMQIGEQRGKAEGKLETARNMLARGFDVQTISELTGLGESEILALKNRE